MVAERVEPRRIMQPISRLEAPGLTITGYATVAGLLYHEQTLLGDYWYGARAGVRSPVYTTQDAAMLWLERR